VAATMICAHLAGLRVFATGGIGGSTAASRRVSTSRPISTSSPARP
jgi:pseudouridine-5'-phosphate glycosidase